MYLPMHFSNCSLCVGFMWQRLFVILFKLCRLSLVWFYFVVAHMFFKTCMTKYLCYKSDKKIAKNTLYACLLVLSPYKSECQTIHHTNQDKLVERN